MSKAAPIRLESIRDPKEKEILALLKEQEECIYGDIIKQTNLSYSKGKELIYALISKGFIKYKGRSTKLELAIEVI